LSVVYFDASVSVWSTFCYNEVYKSVI